MENNIIFPRIFYFLARGYSIYRLNRNIISYFFLRSAYSPRRVRTVAAPPSIVVKCGGVVPRMVVLGVVLVVSCVVLFLLCVCACGQFLFLHNSSPLHRDAIGGLPEIKSRHARGHVATGAPRSFATHGADPCYPYSHHCSPFHGRLICKEHTSTHAQGTDPRVALGA